MLNFLSLGNDLPTIADLFVEIRPNSLGPFNVTKSEIFYSYYFITAKSHHVEKSVSLNLKNQNYHTFCKENSISHSNFEIM